MASRRERVVSGLAQGKQILPRRSDRSGISTHSSHIFWGFRSVGHVVGFTYLLRLSCLFYIYLTRSLLISGTFTKGKQPSWAMYFTLGFPVLIFGQIDGFQ
jgi:hypothetical protein